MVTERFAEWAATTPKITSELALHRGRQALMDVLGCMIAGTDDITARKVRAASASWGNGPATVVGEETPRAAPVAALANGTAAHVLDYDDNYFPAKGHPTAVAGGALFALAEEHGKSGADLLDAYLVAIELMGRFGQALNLTHYEKGWHATGTLIPVGAAAGAARMLGLDTAGVRNAISLAVSMASGTKRQFGTMAKPFHAGMGAQNALMAASLAAAGIEAHPEPLEGRWAMRDLYAGPDSPGFEEALAQLGNPLAIEQFGIQMKPYPCCGSVHRSLDGLLELVNKNGVLWHEVEAVDTTVPQANYQNLMYDRPTNEMEMRFSMQYGLANGLIDGGLFVHHFKPGMQDRDEIKELLPRINMHVYPENSVSSDMAKQKPAQVTIRMKDGKQLEASVQFPLGAAEKPMSDEQLAGKFRDCAANGGVSPEIAEALVAGIGNLQEVERFGDLMALLRRPARAAAAE